MRLRGRVDLNVEKWRQFICNFVCILICFRMLMIFSHIYWVYTLHWSETQLWRRNHPRPNADSENRSIVERQKNKRMKESKMNELATYYFHPYIWLAYSYCLQKQNSTVFLVALVDLAGPNFSLLFFFFFGKGAPILKPPGSATETRGLSKIKERIHFSKKAFIQKHAIIEKVQAQKIRLSILSPQSNWLACNNCKE